MSARVTAPEAELLRLARAVVGASSYGTVERLLGTPRAAPARLGPTAMRLLKETLSQGVARAVMRGGGWRQENGQRLWERGPLPALEFHPTSFLLLQWMLRTPLSSEPVAQPDPAKPARGPGAAELPPGPAGSSWADELLLALALTLVAQTDCERALASHPWVRSSPMCWVVEPLAIARGLAQEPELPGFELSKDAPLTFFLEAWQPTLARSWARMEQTKGRLADPGELALGGRAQAAVLSALLKAADAAGRRELAGFLIEAGAQVLQPGLTADTWLKRLSPTAPLRSRAEARKEAGAFLKALGQLRVWDQQHRSVRFFEDGYPQAQAMVKAWEVFGDQGFREAERLLSELEHPV